MNKVHIAWAGNYEERRIVGVFTDKAAADLVDDSHDSETWTVSTETAAQVGARLERENLRRLVQNLTNQRAAIEHHAQQQVESIKNQLAEVTARLLALGE